jgi:FdhD protein
VSNQTQTEVIVLRSGAHHQAVSAADWVASEEPLEIRVRGRGLAVTMRTPGHDAELACGFLVTEGLVRNRSDVLEIAHCQNEPGWPGNILNVFLAPSVAIDFEKLSRHTYASSSCGLCGKASIESIHQHFPPIAGKQRIAAATLGELPGKLLAAQPAFAKTGGLHGAAIFDLRGGLLVVREDVGRHNAVDKCIGSAFLNGLLPLSEQVLLVSGRASFEIMQKSLAAGLPIVAAVSAPSSLAVECARESGQTLVGFLRGSTFNIYSHPERITTQP